VLPPPIDSLSITHTLSQTRNKGNMPKKKGAEKKAVLQAKKEAKADRKAHKRLVKEQLQEQPQQQELDGSSFDAFLDAYRTTSETTTTTSTLLSGFPLPRSNATLTLNSNTNNKTHVAYLFGGEYYNGAEQVVVNQLFRLDLSTCTWHQIHSPAPPPARCAHSACWYQTALYVFGGETHNAKDGTYYHYNDTWCFDTSSTNKLGEWRRVRCRGRIPSARSGHASVVWKHYMIAFGGFYDAGITTGTTSTTTARWFHDVCVLNLQTHEWMDIVTSGMSQSNRPEARSAMNYALLDNTLVVHGGCSKWSARKDQKETTIVHTDVWKLHLQPLLQNEPPVWERWANSQTRLQRTTRLGTVAVPYKSQMLVFGGVVDKDEEGSSKLDSVFYNDLNAYNVERRKWFPVRVVAKQAGTRRRRRRNDNEPEDPVANADPMTTCSDDENSDIEDDQYDNVEGAEGWDLGKLRSNMFAFMDGNGNLIYEKLDDKAVQMKVDSGTTRASDSDEGEETKEQEDDSDEEEESKDDMDRNNSQQTKALKVGFHVVESSSVMILNPETKEPQALARTDPLPRIKPCLFVNGHTLYVYGGLLEVGDREVTLDDMWTLDLRKRDKWECVFGGTMYAQVWRGAVNDDEDSYYSSTAGGEGDNGNDNSEDDLDESDDEDVLDEPGSSPLRNKRTEIDNTSGLDNDDDPIPRPLPSESVANFYARTSDYWTNQAAAAAAAGQVDKDVLLSAKELKRQGFALAKERFDEREPVLVCFKDMDIVSSGKSKSSKETRNPSRR
jgi:hypothetical protein